MIAAVFWLGIALFAGLFYSMQLLQHWPLPKIAVLSPGRIRLIHTNLIAFGFLTNSFLAMLYWTVPRLTGCATASKKLGWLIFSAWNGIILATRIGLHLGEAQAVEWGETPVWVDPLVVVGAILVWIQFYTPIVKTKEKALYVSLWYFTAGFIWLGLTYIMGNFFPQYLVAGNAAGPLLGLYIHDLVGLWVTPMGWGMMYFFVPVILKKPIWSHALSLVGFWGLAFFYPLQGVHHFLGSPIPMFAQYSAVVSTIAIEIVVTTVIINFFMTWKGNEGTLRTSIPIRWFWLGALNYFITCFQCLPGHPDLPAGHPLHGLGRGPCPPGDVRSLQLLDLRHGGAPMAQAHGQQLVERGAAALELLAHRSRPLGNVPHPDGGGHRGRVHVHESGGEGDDPSDHEAFLAGKNHRRNFDHHRIQLLRRQHADDRAGGQGRPRGHGLHPIRGRRAEGGRNWSGLVSSSW